MGDESQRTRFLENVRKSVRRPDECWPWTGYIAGNGYAMVTTNGKAQGAYCAVWELLVGPIPEGFELDHKCKNRTCVNPWHLEPVPPYVNNMRSNSPAAQAARATSCVNGHPWSMDNTGWRKPQRPGLGPTRICRACRRLKMRAYVAAARAS